MGELSPREYGVLYALSKRRAACGSPSFGNDVLLTQPGMSRLVARLETAGLVERVDDPADGRACRIRLTEAGAPPSGRSACGTDSTSPRR